MFDPLSERLVALTPSLARLLLESRVGADRQQRQEALGDPGRHVQREPAAHRVADEVGTLDPEVIPQHLEVRGAGVHRARRARLDPRFTMAAKVGHHPLRTGGMVEMSSCQLRPLWVKPWRRVTGVPSPATK